MTEFTVELHTLYEVTKRLQEISKVSPVAQNRLKTIMENIRDLRSRSVAINETIYRFSSNESSVR